MSIQFVDIKDIGKESRHHEERSEFKTVSDVVIQPYLWIATKI